MPDLDLCYLSAAEALDRFKAKTLSPAELMEAVIARSAEVQPRLNPFTFTYYGEAMEAARASEARYARGEPTGSLDGLPVAIKDESFIAGQPTSFGSLFMKDFVPDHTSATNARIMEAGGIVHARTATPEFSCAGYTWSRLWGITRNPWNPDFTPGGSSGGSAAALASGMATVATGSDIGGSIRIPASACGLVGFKPPYGRNPDDPPFNLDPYCHTGPIARTVTDAILLQNVMCGPYEKDIATLRPKLTLPSNYMPIKDWKIAYSRDLGAFEVDPEVEKNTLAALDVFRSLGARVDEVDLGWGPWVLEAGLEHLNHTTGSELSMLLEEHGEEMCDYTRQLAERGAMSTGRIFMATMQAAARMYESLGPLLEEYNVLICPTNALPAVSAGFNHATDTVEINGKAVDPVLGWVMTTPFNTMSRCPVLAVPSGRASNGVPTGIQIVGRTYCDADVMQAGMAYETALGGWYGSPEARPAL
mgnify:CR=1 FL=1